jgi:hypothetical protein
MPNEPSDPHVVSDPEGRAISQAVLFPVNMGNHARRSGNFLFEFDDEGAISEAIKIGKQATGLECVVRRFFRPSHCECCRADERHNRKRLGGFQQSACA